MDYTVEKKNNYSVVTTTATKLNTANAPDLKSEFVLLTNEGHKNIILDMNSCEYCDSSGLSSILVANRLCEQLEGKFILTGLQPEVESLIKVSLLDTILEIKENVDEATEVMEKEVE